MFSFHFQTKVLKMSPDVTGKIKLITLQKNVVEYLKCPWFFNEDKLRYKKR
jgi:hypothetical protein